ncbi:hypothetical protein [Streptomyces sp. NRRL B-1347]|uniref:hypothetical protein n=1 Tax=Streptomyces sp. NRRL B-1347 TaxID=1476877 RepID=UPI0004C61DD2|nr:hypothetical protein [Streptomyces sp. NRRL B-1347]
MTGTIKSARLMAQLAEAEETAAAARREESRTARQAERAAARTKAARARLTEARKALRAAERAGRRVAAARRTVAAREAKLADLAATARALKGEATTARRETRRAERRLTRLGLRTAVAASRTVEKISRRLGETSLTPAPEADRVLDADELPAVEEIEAHALRHADMDRQAKDFAKAADAEKTWLRTLPSGIYGRVIITRTPGRSVLDNTQVALDYAARGLAAPRKSTRTTFKADATQLVADFNNGRADFPRTLAA